jgi:hypothetical protein
MFTIKPRFGRSKIAPKRITMANNKDTLGNLTKKIPIIEETQIKHKEIGEHTSELQSLATISYSGLCLNKKMSV